MSMTGSVRGWLVAVALTAVVALPSFAQISDPPSPPSDIVVSGSAAATIAPGGDLIYFITVSTQGPSPSGFVSYSLVTPPGTAFLGLGTIALDPPGRPAATDCVTPPAGGTGVIRCSVQNLTVPGSAGGFLVSIAVVHLRVLATSGSIVNLVSATRADDPNPSNNVSTSTTTVDASGASADISVELTGPDAVEERATAAYTIRVRNNGPAPTSNLNLSFALPPGVACDSFTSPDLACIQTTTPQGLRCVTPAVLPPGWSTSISVGSHMDVPAGTVATASAHVFANEGDPVPSNNDVTLTTFVLPANGPDLILSPTTVNVPASQPFTFTAYVHNSGATPLTDVVLSDFPPAGMTLLHATPSAGSCQIVVVSPPLPDSAPTTYLDCRASSLAPGDTISVTITATPPAASAVNHLSTTAGISTSGADLTVNVLGTSRHRAARH